MRSVYTLPPNLDKLTRKQLELRKEKTQELIEDLETEISVFDGIILNIISKQDELKNKMPLVTYGPLRKELDARYDELQVEKSSKEKEYQDLKHEIATLIYNLEQLDIALNTIQEYADQSSY